MNALVSPHTLQTWLHDGAEIALFDVREHGHYGAAHLFYGVSLPYSRLEIEVGRLAPNPNVRLVVYDENGDDVAPRALERLRALGYRQVWRLAGGLQGWRGAGYEVFAGVNVPSKTFGELIEVQCHTPHLTAQELHERQARGEPLLLLDGRPLDEFRKMTIPGSRCCPNGELAYRVGELVADETTPIVINCAGRTRSIIGAQTLINLGVKNPVYALENGTQGWFLADLALEHGATRRHAPGPAAGAQHLAGAARQLAERAGVRWVDAAQVRRWAAEPDRSLFLCDVRAPEEFAAGSLPGAQHAPGGQLVQATDHYVGVRGARLVLVDADDVRAATTASWLRQLGHEAYVLSDGIHSGLALAPLHAPALPVLAVLDSAAVAALGETVALVDLRPSAAFLASRLPGARWSIRPRLAADLAREERAVVLIASDPGVAALALRELPSAQAARARVLLEVPDAWEAAGLAVSQGGAPLSDAERSDFLFFTHGRHDGDKAASRQYLAWELGLLDQLGAEELAGFRPLLVEGRA